MHKYILLTLSCLMIFNSSSSFAEKPDSAIRDALVKIYTIHNRPDYYNPWSMHGPRRSTGSGCIVEGNKILTNAHVISDQTYIEVRKHGNPKRWRARLNNVSHHADLALLTVDDPTFFENTKPIELSDTLPETQDDILVYGFPLGGDTMSTTKGVVSRIEHRTYAHSSSFLFAGQIDSAINAGNSGGPVIKEGEIVGVVMQTLTGSDNIGYMVPVNVVKHFFDDVKDGRYDGFPSLGIVLQGMENPALKKRFGMNEEQTGVLVTRVLPDAPAGELIRKKDVILKINGFDIADDGTVEFREGERTAVSYTIQESQVGDTVEIVRLREGQVSNISVRIDRDIDDDYLVPLEEFDVRPTYYIYGGLVFCPLSKDLMQAWGSNWYNRAPKTLVNLLSQNYQDPEIDEVVLMLKVLASEENKGYHENSYWIIKEVNGKVISSLKQMIDILQDPAEGEWAEFLSDSGNYMVLNREEALSSKEKILRMYQVPSDRSADLLTQRN